MRFVFRSTQLMDIVFRNRNIILINLTEVQGKVGIVRPIEIWVTKILNLEGSIDKPKYNGH